MSRFAWCLVLLLVVSAAASLWFALELHLGGQQHAVEAGAGANTSQNASLRASPALLRGGGNHSKPLFTILLSSTPPPPSISTSTPAPILVSFRNETKALRGVKEFTLQSCSSPAGSESVVSKLDLKPGFGVGPAGLTQPMRALLQGAPENIVVKTVPKPHWLHVVAAMGDDHPTNALRREKIWEPGLTVLIRWAFEVGCSQEDCLVVDIGMNIGWYTGLSAAHGKNVLAFEPNPAPMIFGQKTAELNDWGSRVRIVNGGLSQDGAPLYVRADISNSGSRAAERSSSYNSVKVLSHRLDDLIAESARICFLKADCQGCEPDAFLSGAKLIGAGNIQMVMLEFDHTDRARRALTTLQRLSPRPFHCLLIPVNLRAESEDVDNPRSPGYEEIWDLAAVSILEPCDVQKIDAIAPKIVPEGYYTDLLLLSDNILKKMKQDPHFLAAEARQRAVANQSCSYTAMTSTDLGFCDLLCRNFASLEEAQRQCNVRPSCKKILLEFGHFELRGGARPYGSRVARGHLKQQCS